MTALEYMRNKVEKHKLNLHRAIAKKATESEISGIKDKIGYYAEAERALRKEDEGK